MTDRKELADAIRDAKECEARGGYYEGLIHVHSDTIRSLVYGAEAHLATLPKPQWKVRVWANDADICTVSRFCDRGDAIEFVITVTRTPVRKVEIEAP